MPIVFTCPSCQKKISAPDEAAGKKVRCPRCAVPAPVPLDLFEPAPEPQPEPVVEATAAPPKPKSAPVKAEIADTPPKKKSRDDDDDRPRKKRRRNDRPYDRPPRQNGGGTGILLMIVSGLALVLFIAGGVGYLILFRNSDPDLGLGGPSSSKDAPPNGLDSGLELPSLNGKSAPRSAPPNGWRQYRSKDGVVRAYMPSEPGEETKGIPQRTVVGRIANPESITRLTSLERSQSVSVTVAVTRFSCDIPSSERKGILESMIIKDSKVQNIRWLGGDALEIRNGLTVRRCVCVGRYYIVAEIWNIDNTPLSPNIEAGFLDNVEYLK